MSWQFDGTTSRAFVPSGAWTFFPKEGWSVSVWWKILGTGVNNHQHFMFHRSGAGIGDANTASIRINESTNAVTALIRTDSNNFMDMVHSPGSINEWTASGWTHAVMTRSRALPNATASVVSDDTSVGRLYINGNLMDTDDTHTGLDDLNMGFIVFGKRGDTASAVTLSGCLAEWAKWDRVITSEEVQRLYRGNSPLNMNPTLYFPMRNDYIERVIGLTGIGINNVAILSEHPVAGYRTYYPTTEVSTNMNSVYNRIGKIEEKGYVDFINWAPGQISPTGCAQSGFLFSQAQVGEAYQVAANGNMSGCISTAQIDVSGILTISIRNPGATAVTVGATRFNVYRI